MKLIVGLGNPGIEYQFTWHNLGFLVIDRLAEQCGAQVANRHCRALTGKCNIAGNQVLLAKPETYMNLSGVAVRELIEKHELDPVQDLIVIYDELDLPVGTLRIRQRGSSAGHNGLESIIGALGTQEFLRIRLGIAPDRPLGDGAKYVLSQIRKAQYTVIDQTLELAADAVNVILTQGASVAMNRFNRKAEGNGTAVAE